MESKGCKRFATTEAEIEEKRLKLNAERQSPFRKKSYTEDKLCLYILNVERASKYISMLQSLSIILFIQLA
jgi:hypothetical protein